MLKYVIHDTKTGTDGGRYTNEATARRVLSQAIPAGRFVIRIKDGNKILDTIEGDK